MAMGGGGSISEDSELLGVSLGTVSIKQSSNQKAKKQNRNWGKTLGGRQKKSDPSEKGFLNKNVTQKAVVLSMGRARKKGKRGALSPEGKSKSADCPLETRKNYRNGASAGTCGEGGEGGKVGVPQKMDKTETRGNHKRGPKKNKVHA